MGWDVGVVADGVVVPCGAIIPVPRPVAVDDGAWGIGVVASRRGGVGIAVGIVLDGEDNTLARGRAVAADSNPGKRDLWPPDVEAPPPFCVARRRRLRATSSGRRDSGVLGISSGRDGGGGGGGGNARDMDEGAGVGRLGGGKEKWREGEV